MRAGVWRMLPRSAKELGHAEMSMTLPHATDTDHQHGSRQKQAVYF